MNAKEFISSHIFDNKIELYVNAIQNKYYGETTLITIEVDHKRFWSGSKFFDPEYFQIIDNVREDIYTEKIEDLLPLIALPENYMLDFIHSNTKIYERFLKIIESLGYDVRFVFEDYSPYAYFYVYGSDQDLEDLYVTLEDRYNFHLDDTVLISE